jgi:aldehyde dehydrogenase (NAD+)
MSQFWREERLLIDGKLVPASGGRTYPNENPATEEIIGVAADASKEDVLAAVAAARRAFDTTDWSTNLELRKRCLRQLQTALEEKREQFRAMKVAEVGCPILLTYGPQLDTPINLFIPHMLKFLDSYSFTEDLGVAELMGMKSHRWIEREAVGVVAAITAWNFPTELNLKKLSSALGAGNTVILKGAPSTPWSTLVLGQLIAEKTDIPPGVVNILTSSQKDIGEIMTTHPDVDMVTFTGSTAVGKRILTCAADTVKKVTLELGGKSPYVVLDDADLAKTVPGAGVMICSHAGQGCAILSRLIVPRRMQAQAVEIVKATMQNLKYGDPFDPQNFMGPVNSAAQRDRIEGIIARAKQAGAKLALGGGRPKHLPKGHFIEPTLFYDVDPDSELAQFEVFGPVLAVIPYDDEEHAIRIANNSPYGLSGGVWSADHQRAKRVARRIRSGTMMVNGGIYYGPEVPFGGYRQSGLGRENGVAGFEEYLQIKSLCEPA